MGMKIEVLNSAGGDTAQMRAYAEYRVFSRLAPLARHVAAVTVVIAPSPEGRTLCVVTLEFESGLRIKREGRHAHPVLAIDAATSAIATAAHAWSTRLAHGA
jgi:ribosome-associated translation inhibitor RaiA